MNRQDFRFFHALRVRWVEVDMQKIVFNGHYLMYLDTAVSDYWRALALPYEQSLHGMGGDLFVVKSTLEYKASAVYDDLLHIGMRCARIGNSSIVFEGVVFRGEQVLVKGELVYVYADPQTQTSKPVPQALRDPLLGFEQGEAMTRLQLGTWAELKPLTGPLRTEVFVQEQGVDQALEWDSRDEHCVHAVLCNRLGLPVATGRLPPSGHGAWPQPVCPIQKKSCLPWKRPISINTTRWPLVNADPRRTKSVTISKPICIAFTADGFTKSFTTHACACM